ncbi:MAG: hypothetical protein AAB830_01740 [Patescibacteria group bacterium]
MMTHVGIIADISTKVRPWLTISTKVGPWLKLPGDKGFFGSKPFSKTNGYPEARNKKPID